MPLPKFLQSYFPSYDISKMDIKNPDDQREIITQILNHGNPKDISWLFKTYEAKTIKRVVSCPQRGHWQKRALNYWAKIFNINFLDVVYSTALLSFSPRPKLMEKYFKKIKSKS